MSSGLSLLKSAGERPARPGRAERAWEETLIKGRELLRAKARSFHLATGMLPAELRDDIAVVYAFCRTADDLADESEHPADARNALLRLDAELAGRRPPGKLVTALARVAERHAFTLEHARVLLDGVRTDLDVVRIADDQALLQYCYRVASTVGLMISRVLGVRDPAAEPFAVDLGLAMQLTNIVRDVREDVARNRVYLPCTRLRAHGITPEQLCRFAVEREPLRQVCLELLALADRHYRSAARGLTFIPFRARFGIAVASRVYASIGWRTRRLRHHPLDGRMIVPRSEKLWRIGESAAVTVASAFARPVTHDPALQVALHAAPDLLRARG